MPVICQSRDASLIFLVMLRGEIIFVLDDIAINKIHMV